MKEIFNQTILEIGDYKLKLAMLLMISLIIVICLIVLFGVKNCLQF